MRSTTLWGLIFLSLASILWGGTVVPSKFLLASITPITLAAMRFGVAALVLMPLAFWRYHRIHGFQAMQWGRLIVQGLMGVTFYYIASYWSLKLTSAVHASLISAALPLLTMMVSAAVLRERLTLRQWGACMAAIAGVLMIIFPIDETGATSSLTGDLLAVAAALFWAFYTAFTKHWESKLPSDVMTAWVATFGCLFLIPFALLQGSLQEFQPLTTAPGLISLLYLGVGASAIAYFLWNKSLEYVSASVAGVTLNLLPVVALAASVLVLGEKAGALAVVGGLLSVAAVFWATVERPKAAEQAAPKRTRSARR